MDHRFIKFPRKSSHLFFVTVSYTSLSKEQIFLSLEDFCLKLVVGEEYQVEASTHLIFIKALEKHTPKEIQAIVEKIYELDEFKNDQRLHIHIGSSRHQRDALKFISRHDTTLFSKRVSSLELSFYYRAVESSVGIRTRKFEPVRKDRSQNGSNPVRTRLYYEPRFERVSSPVFIISRRWDNALKTFHIV